MSFAASSNSEKGRMSSWMKQSLYSFFFFAPALISLCFSSVVEWKQINNTPRSSGCAPPRQALQCWQLYAIPTSNKSLTYCATLTGYCLRLICSMVVSTVLSYFSSMMMAGESTFLRGMSTKSAKSLPVANSRWMM